MKIIYPENLEGRNNVDPWCLNTWSRLSILLKFLIGVVDGDSITVFVNDNVVVSNQKLSTKPVTAFVRVDVNNPFQEVEMKAENLGSIPPNTALVLITAGTKRYRLFLTSTKTNTAIIRFVYSKDSTSTQEISKY